MKKLLFLLALIVVNVSVFAGTYDFNTRVTQNDNVVGGNFVVEVQVRSTAGTFRIGGTDPGGASGFTAGGLVVWLEMNESTLTYASGVVDPVLNPFEINQIVYENSYVDGVKIRARTNNEAVFVDFNTTWTTIATITYTIVSLDTDLDFSFNSTYSKLMNYVGSNIIVHNQGDIANEVVNDNNVWSGGNGPGKSVANNEEDLAKKLIVRNSVVPVLATGTFNYRVDSYSIESTGKVEIGPNASFEPWSRIPADYIMDGTLEVLADASGYGQYKGPAVDITFNQYYGTHNGWRNIGFPVTGANNFAWGMSMKMKGGTSARCQPTSCGAWGVTRGDSANIYEFTAGLAEATNLPQGGLSPGNGPNCTLGAQTLACGLDVEHEYVGLSGDPSGGTQGYLLWAGVHPDAGGFTSNRFLDYPITTGIISVDGTSIVDATYNYVQTVPHAGGTGSMSLRPAAVQARYDGWRIISNPFTCNLNIVAWAVANGVAVSPHVYNSSGPSLPNSFPANSANPDIIAPGQSFFFKTNADKVLTFNLYRDGIISNAAVLKTSDPIVKLNLTNTDGYTANATIAFNDNATEGYDALYDGFFKGISVFEEDAISLAFNNLVEIDGNEVNSLLSLNTIDDALFGKTFDLYMSNTQSQELTFSVDVSNLPQGVTVAIEDKLLAPGVLNDIVTDTYTFKSEAGEKRNRFVVHLNSNKKSIARAYTSNNMTAWFNEDVLNLKSELSLEGASVEIMNTAGQLVASGLSNDQLVVTKSGIYIVMVTFENGSTQSIKVIK